MEGIRPILPLIRNTPYGKRIQSKLQREQLDVPNSSHFAYPNQQANLSPTGHGLNQNVHGVTGFGHGQGQGQGHSHGHGHGNNHGHNRHTHHQQTPYPHVSHHHQQASRHATQLADVYNSQNTLYNIGRNSTDTHAHAHAHAQQNTVGHGQQTLQNVQAHHPIDGYVLQGDSSHNHGINTPTNGFNSINAYPTVPMVHSYGNAVGLNGSMNGSYHRPSFGYGM